MSTFTNFMRRRSGVPSLTATLSMVAGAALMLAASTDVHAGPATFAEWIDAFRSRAVARGVSSATYARVTQALAPDATVFDELRNQPEFNEQLWQYLNRRVSDWRITTGKEKLAQHAALLDRIERDYGVDRSVILGIWGIESAYGDPVVQKNHTRPVLPALATLAWGEPRRRTFWENQFLDALVIVERGWSTPDEMVGSWAGAMGHTQWMPEVWLNVGFDYDGDGRVSPFGAPDDALGSTARYLVERGKYRRGERWGYEVRLPAGSKRRDAPQTYAAWHEAGVARADREPFPEPLATARLWEPVSGGPAFLLGPNFYAVHAYNPSMSYTLAIVLLGDRVVGAAPLVQQFPGSDRPPTLAEVQEIQRRLSALGFDTGGTDGRVGNDTMRAVREFQRKIGMQPADGYAGVAVLSRLRAAR
jgi:membrane-bound lytic murein transglycosylase B